MEDYKQTLIFLHLHRTGGTTLFFIMKRYFDADTIHRIDETKKTKKNSTEYFLNLPQKQRDRIKLLRGHMPFGLHAYFSHPCDYITILRDPAERIFSEYSRFIMWPDRSHIKNFEKLDGMTFKDFINSRLVAVNNYQTSVLSGNWKGQYEEAEPLGWEALEKAKDNLIRYFKMVGTTDRHDETILVLAKKFGWKNYYYFEKKNISKRDNSIPEECRKIIADRNKLDIELYNFAGRMLDEAIVSYGQNFNKDLRRLRYANKILTRFWKIGRRMPFFLRKPVKLMLPIGLRWE